jgi:hypothetical protein
MVKHSLFLGAVCGLGIFTIGVAMSIFFILW